MEFSVKSGSPEKQRTACIVVGVFEPRRLSIEGKIGQTLLLHNVPDALAERVLLVGCGRERELGEMQYRKIVASAISTLNDTGSMECVVCLTELGVKAQDIHWRIRQVVEVSNDTLYRFDQLKSKKDNTRRPLRRIVLNVPKRSDLSIGEKAILQGNAIAAGVRVAKDLGNLPGNICTPSYLAKQAKSLGKETAVKVTVHDKTAMEKMGMGALLAVAQGSTQAPRLITVEYNNGHKKDAPIILV